MRANAILRAAFLVSAALCLSFSLPAGRWGRTSAQTSVGRRHFSR